LTIGTLGGVATTGIFSDAPVVIGSSGVGNGLTVGSIGTPQNTLMNGNLDVTGNINSTAGSINAFADSTFSGGLNVGAGLDVTSGDVIVDAGNIGNIEVTAGGVGIGNAPGAAGTLTVNGSGTFNGGILTNSLGIIAGPGVTAVSVSGNVDITTGNELAVDSITSNAGQDLTILPATGQNVVIQPTGVGSEVNITGSNISITSGFKVANTGPMTAPVNANDAGTLGDIRWGTDTGVRYLYICVAANAWERVALATWP